MLHLEGISITSGLQVRTVLKGLKLSNKKVAIRERAREDKEGKVEAPWPITLAYDALCWSLDIMYNNRPIQRWAVAKRPGCFWGLAAQPARQRAQSVADHVSHNNGIQSWTVMLDCVPKQSGSALQISPVPQQHRGLHPPILVEADRPNKQQGGTHTKLCRHAQPLTAKGPLRGQQY